MANILPPVPVGVPPDHSFWNDWYEKLRNLVNTGAVTVLWANINFTGSNITSIVNRAHNNLQSIQGGAPGEYFHLTAAQASSLGAGNHNDLLSIQGGSASERYHLSLLQQQRVAGFITKAGAPTTSDIAAGQWALYKDSVSGNLVLAANDAGTIKTVLLT